MHNVLFVKMHSVLIVDLIGLAYLFYDKNDTFTVCDNTATCCGKDLFMHNT